MVKIFERARRIEKNFLKSSAFKILIAAYIIGIVGGLTLTLREQYSQEAVMIAEISGIETKAENLSLIAVKYEELKNDDQVVKNASLAAEISAIGQTYGNGAKLFESRADLAVAGIKTREIDLSLAKFLSFLGKKEYAEADKQIASTQALIDKLIAESVPKVPAIADTTPSNTLPGSGYTKQKVSTSRGDFVVSMIVAPGARAVIETSGDSDCSDNCPTKSLAEHIAASGGFAGINGAYFCPPDYPQCQGKINTFDTLAVNGRTKAVLNRANNVFSVVPIVVANGTTLNFYDQTVQWGIETSGGGALANYPRLVRDGGVANTQENGKGTRGFVGMKDGAIVIGHIYAASFADTAEALKTLGLQNAMNLDGGGSTALWYQGSYKAGPGRSLPTAIVLLR